MASIRYHRAHPSLSNAPAGTAAAPATQSEHPTITADRLLAITDTDKRTLMDIHELLDRLFVRNKNQHRRSHWFRPLSMFRKQLGLLNQELRGLKAGDLGKKEGVERRLVYWDRECVHDWYLTFTQLVAANQFAILGLVLMAAIARVCKITGITELYEEIGSEHMRIVLETFDAGSAVDQFGGLEPGLHGVAVANEEEEEEEDLGEVVEREDEEDEEDKEDEEDEYMGF